MDYNEIFEVFETKMTPDEKFELANSLEEVQGWCKFTGKKESVWNAFEELLRKIKEARDSK